MILSGWGPESGTYSHSELSLPEGPEVAGVVCSNRLGCSIEPGTLFFLSVRIRRLV